MLGVKEIFQAVLHHAPTIGGITHLRCRSPSLTFAGAQVCAIQPPAGFEALTRAISERCARTTVYERGLQRTPPRKITPRVVLEARGVAYVIAHCHLSDAERTFG